MPQDRIPRKQYVREIRERLKRGPSLSRMSYDHRNMTAKQIEEMMERDVKIWLETWIEPYFTALHPEDN